MLPRLVNEWKERKIWEKNVEEIENSGTIFQLSVQTNARENPFKKVLLLIINRFKPSLKYRQSFPNLSFYPKYEHMLIPLHRQGSCYF